MNAISPPFATHPRRASTAFVQVRSGACVDLLIPDLTPVSLEDIATGLSRTARFNGHTRGAAIYTVAQHSLHVAQAVEACGYTPAVQLTALFHDAAEALIGDVVTPVKRLLGPAWWAIESRMEAAIRARFGLPLPMDYAPIRQADAALLATERRDLLLPSAWTWGEDLPAALDLRIEPMEQSVAYTRWLSAASALADRCGAGPHA